MDFTDNEVMKIQASTLYVLNDENRIVRINEKTEVSPPAIFIGKTKFSIHTYFRNDISQGMIDEINPYISESLNILDL
ncbi:hypothetical protein [Paenibacillus sp. KN14-4R]|uniref:hypothetical protein n=1 Tax=Paenibacillus sp. KN14-4R TaxID=3445773 RepID=UPI003FA08CDB